MATFIYDTDATLTDGTTTFSVWADVLDAIRTDSGGSSVLNNGPVTVNLRNSSGVPCTEYLNFDGLTPSVGNNVILMAQISNNNPFILTEESNTANTALMGIRDDEVTVDAESFGAGIIRALEGVALDRVLVSATKWTTINNWILSGDATLQHCGAISASSSGLAVTNCLIENCYRSFYGAMRATTSSTIDRSIIRNCRGIRTCGPITNTIFIDAGVQNTGSNNDGIDAGSDNNAYDIAKASVIYAVDGSGDTNSLFSVDFNAETYPLSVHGYDYVAPKSTSALATAASDAGAISINGVSDPEAASVVGPIVRGGAFDITLTGHRSSGYARVFLYEEGGDATDYECDVNTYTSYNLNATAPTTGNMPAFAQARVKIRPITN